MRPKIQSPISAAFGFLCVAGTLFVLFGHLRAFADITVNHVYVLVSLFVAMGAGYFMGEAWDEGSWFTSSLFALLWFVATIICVGLSGGRSADLFARNDTSAKEQANKIKDQERVVERFARQLEEARAATARAEHEVDDVTPEFKRECIDGKGKKCDGATVVMSAATSKRDTAKVDQTRAFNAYEAELTRLRSMPPPSKPNGDLVQFARLYAFVFKTTDDNALEAIKLLLPYALSLVIEFGAIMFIHYGFKRRKQRAVDPERQVSIADIATELGIETRVARKHLRTLNVAKPARGWQWAAKDAEVIAASIAKSAGIAH